MVWVYLLFAFMAVIIIIAGWMNTQPKWVEFWTSELGGHRWGVDKYRLTIHSAALGGWANRRTEVVEMRMCEKCHKPYPDDTEEYYETSGQDCFDILKIEPIKILTEVNKA